MRPIKYKAWHKTNEVMYDVSGLAFYNKLCEVFDPEVNDRVRILAFPLEDVILLQDTGLKDKNGREIYGGDVVELHQFLFDGFSEVESELTGVVVYQEETCSFALDRVDNKNIKEYMGFEENEEIGPLPIFLFHGIHEESFTVIGNIYEDKHLLEVQT